MVVVEVLVDVVVAGTIVVVVVDTEEVVVVLILVVVVVTNDDEVVVPDLIVEDVGIVVDGVTPAEGGPTSVEVGFELDETVVLGPVLV